MKEASGELNMTLITIVAIAAIAGLFAFLWPTIKKNIIDKWNGTSGELDNISYVIDSNYEDLM